MVVLQILLLCKRMLGILSPGYPGNKNLDTYQILSSKFDYITAIRSMYRHVMCNGPVSCKANGVGNQLGAWRYSDLL